MLTVLFAETDNPLLVQALPFVTILIVFGITYWLLAGKVWPIITKALDERDAKIRNDLKSAEEAREQAKATLSEYERNLAKAREEANQMIVKAKSDAKAVADDLRRRNETELAELKQRALQDIESAKAAAINEIHAEASTLAISVASKILQREISADDQQRLVEQSLSEMATSSN